MTANTIRCRHAIIWVMMAFLALAAHAERTESGKVAIIYEPADDGSIKVTDVINSSDIRINLSVDGTIVTVNGKSSHKPNLRAKKEVGYTYSTGNGAMLWRYTPPKEKQPETSSSAQQQEENGKTTETAISEKPAVQTPDMSKSRKPDRRTAADLGLMERLNADPFFSQDAVNEYIRLTDSYCDGLMGATDRPQYIIDHDLRPFLEKSQTELDSVRNLIPQIAREMVAGEKISDASRATTTELITETLYSRLRSREEACQRLDRLVTEPPGLSGMPLNLSKEDLINYGIVGGILLLVLILAIVTIRRKSRKKKTSAHYGSRGVTAHQADGDNPAIVVRRRTTSILKKQCIDDVVDNPAYLLIEAADFTPDSAVRKIYVRNTCIKEVYNLYAEDLRNSDSPMEDGCMVLGRWVHDEATHTYDISLEEVVFPGDDAIFKEYELNFGGKIKLRIADRLRKLRRDTNLQYDLVCWIHSHPGLGVFFSNSDNSVQMQLKHTQHPNFLIALVVDILTSTQESGIFTFRRDGSMNSRNDITKMYSLEEMYRWALQSERRSFSPDSYFNVMKGVALKMPECSGVELDNSAIIDLTQILVEPATGIVGWATGSAIDHNGNREYAVSAIARDAEKPKSGIVGCLINVAHMSLPTIQRLISHDGASLSFVMVFSSKQMSLTTIPVINGELLTDDRFYGDVNIDDLKIWTRRKR